MVDEQVKEIEDQIKQLTDMKEGLGNLCKRKDKDVFDVVYNVSGELGKVSPEIENELKDKAIDGKRIDIDPTKTPAEKEENFLGLYGEIRGLFDRCLELLRENLKDLTTPKDKNATTVEKVSRFELNNEKTQMENENSAINNDSDKKYREYNERVKKRASSNEQSYEQSGMQQEMELVMAKPGPSFGTKSDDK